MNELHAQALAENEVREVAKQLSTRYYVRRVNDSEFYTVVDADHQNRTVSGMTTDLDVAKAWQREAHRQWAEREVARRAARAQDGTMEGNVEMFCDCIAGGECLKRGADVHHSVAVWWVDDDRAPDTIATPLALDEWMASGIANGGFCPTCEDDVAVCPAFAKYLLAPGWDLTFWGRAALRDLVRECRKEGAWRLNDLPSGVAYLLATYGGGRVQVGGANISAAAKLHEMWIDDTITLATAYYWYRVLQRFSRLSED